MQTQPWWGTAVIAGVFTIAGVLIGQLVSSRRELRSRWTSDRRTVYAQYSAAFSSYLDTVWMTTHIASSNGDEFEQFMRAAREVEIRNAEIQLISSDKVRRSALFLAAELEAVVREILASKKPMENETRTHLADKLWYFMNDAREELGLGKSAQPPPETGRHARS